MENTTEGYVSDQSGCYMGLWFPSCGPFSVLYLFDLLGGSCHVVSRPVERLSGKELEECT